MADFCQNGVITTLQKLGNRSAGEIDLELKKVSDERKMVLLLPALFSEFKGPAMPKIIKELKGIDYLHRIVLSLDRADEAQFLQAKNMMASLPVEVRVIWHDGPRMKRLLGELASADFQMEIPGKGRSVWMSIGYILAHSDVYAIALHDCDIVNYQREIVSRLLYPVVHPGLDFEFSKGYYARVTDRLYGRVTRLFYTPLIQTLRRMLGYNAFIEYLGNFRYALSGEFAFDTHLAKGIRISPTWGLEVSMLSEVYQKTSVNRICQVEVIESYEHKHQKLDKAHATQGLIRMATDIGNALFRVLSEDGLVMSEAFFRTLLTAYMQESRIAIEKYNALALLNGLEYDRHQEVEAVEAFVTSLKMAMDEFVNDPVGCPMLAAWKRVWAAIPDFSDRLYAVVEEENR
ncbi:MAG: glycosyl transferase [Syntrophobacterales bacterium]|nr:glycosyl transferase [Syntrophobacterales bacterium]